MWNLPPGLSQRLERCFLFSLFKDMLIKPWACLVMQQLRDSFCTWETSLSKTCFEVWASSKWENTANSCLNIWSGICYMQPFKTFQLFRRCSWATLNLCTGVNTSVRTHALGGTPSVQTLLYFFLLFSSPPPCLKSNLTCRNEPGKEGASQIRLAISST